MKLLTPACLTVRNMLLLLLVFRAFSAVAQNTFTDGLSWVSSSAVTSAASPVYSSDYCQEIHYTISTASGLGFQYNPTAVNGSGVLLPGDAGPGNSMEVTITFNVPVANFGMRILDLDEDNQHDGGTAEEYLTNFSITPASVAPVSGLNPIFLSGNTVTPDDGNPGNANGNAAGWIWWSGEVTSITFTYQRYNQQYECVLDSLHFECPCPPQLDHIEDAVMCPQGTHLLDAATPNATYLWNTGSTSSAITATAPGTYWVKVWRESCLETDTAIISPIPTPSLDLGPDSTVCEGETVVLTVDPLLSPVLWQNGASAPDFTAAVQGMYTAQAVYGGCTLRDTFELTVNHYPHVDLGNDTILCEGAEMLLKAPHGYSYLWSNGSTMPAIDATADGVFWVDVSNGSCTASDTIRVQFDPLPPNPLPADTLICRGDPAVITLHVSSGVSYEWFNGSQELQVVVSEAGSYWVESQLNGCLRSDTLRVSEYPAVAESFSYDSLVVICEGKSGSIGPVLSSDLVTVTWDDGNSAPAINVDEPGVHAFTVSTPCENVTHTIRVSEEKCFCNVWLPNAFTPDANSINEGFAAKYDCALDRFELLVFDRWGSIVFAATDPDVVWDGTYNGLPVPDGVYVYKVIYMSAQMETYEEMSGHVSVLR